jgi:hypothetical protein
MGDPASLQITHGPSLTPLSAASARLGHARHAMGAET